MNQHLDYIQEIIKQVENLSDEQTTSVTNSLKDLDKELEILKFKLDRTEKVKRTTAILLEETIEELEQKRKAAHIETALERVRSRSLAMHHSDELEQVAASLFEAIVGLGIAMDGALLFVFDRKKRNITLWVTIVQLTNPVLINLPYEEEMKGNEIILDYWKATDQGLALSKKYTGEAKNEYFRYVQRHNSSTITDQTKELLIGLPAWHLSFAAEKNTMLGLDSWSGHLFTESDLNTLRKFARAFEQAYVRFLDLQKAEVQAREAQIQLSLERIRAKAMAMQHSDELSGFLTVLFEQFDLLNLKPVFCHLSLLDIENNRTTYRTTGKKGSTLIATQEIDFYASPIWKQKIEDWKAGHSYDVDVMYIPYESLPEMAIIFKEILEKLPENERPLPEDFPNGQYVIEGSCKYGYIGYSASKPPLDEEKEITRRIANEFGNVYQRFLDLQKAEAQARESEIEVALEKVRSRSLAMHKSDDLKDVVFSVFERLRELQIQTDSTSIVVYLDESAKMELWTANDMNYPTKFNLPMTGRFYPGETIELRKEQKVFLRHIPFEEKNRYWKELFNTTDFRKVPEARKNFLLEKTDCLIQLVAFGKVTGIMLFRYFNKPFTDAEIEITERFARVFDQAYTRFLDLQKAEAQAREAQIQLSLERIRAKAMAMQHTDELSEFLTVLFEQFEVLNLKPVFCHLSFFDIENNRFTYRMTGRTGAAVIATQEIDFEATPIWKQNVEDWKSGHPYQVGGLYIPKERIPEMTEIFNEILEKLPEDERPLMEDFPDGQYVVDGYCKYGYLGYSAGRPPSDEEKEITRRIANEFGNVYQRFLDLEKAEAQAREAQIQLSLERIRAKAMAMQHSDELSGFLTVLFEQFEVLNLRPVNCILSLYDIENNRSTFRMTGKKGATLIASQEIDLDASPVWKQKVENWKSGHPNDVDVLYIPYENLPEIAEIFKEILEKLPEDERPLPEDYPNGEYIIDGYCKYGYLGYASSGPPSEEEKEITRRIANEFGNVYQRFLDLQKAEAQAREAQIQLSLERIRAKAMAMQHTDELSEFLTVLFEQFEVLNLKPVFCHLSFFDIENNRFTYRMTGRTGAAVIATQEIDFEATPIWKQNVEDWKSGHPYQVGGLYIPKERIPEMTEIFNEILEKLPEDERPLMEDFPDGQYVVDGYCKYGYLGYSAGRPPSDEEKEITRRIANEFGNVYQRFLDLEKAEAQAKEAQIQLSLERIRAKAMAMQHTDELSDFLTVLFEQFTVLGLKPVFCHHSLLDIDNNRFTYRMTGRNGSRLFSSGQIDLNISSVWDDKIQELKSGRPRELDVMYFPNESIPEISSHIKKMLGNPPENELPQLEDFPDGQYVVEGYCKYGYLGYSANRPPSEEEKEIARRIANEFGSVYQRFLDLQKAEAQAREAQIENALEKIRSRTMAMQHSDELTDVAGMLFKQVSALGIKTWTTGFNVWSEDNNSYVDYLSFGEGFIEPNTVHTEKAEALRDVRNARKSGVEFEVLYVEGEKIKELYLALTNLDEKQYELMLQNGVIPSQQYEHFVFGSKVSLMFITYEPVPEAHDIFKRLGKVFEQTYTRFLDLQKAEAQAREAQIQLSLERIRAKAMAMQHSDDLSGFLTVVFEQFEVLNLSPVNCHLSFLDIDNNRSIFRLTGKNGATLIATQEIDMDASPLLKQKMDDWKSGQTKEVDVLYIPYESIPEVGEIFKEILEKLPADECPLPEDYPNGEYIIDGYCKYGFLGYSTSRPPSDEEKEITRRIANEFGNVYQRFLDLQKAEAQAREAQIENALEKVRSRTMAMQHSDELTDVAGLLFNQVSALGIKTWTAGFNVWSEDNNSCVDYISVNGEFIDPYTVHTEKAEALKDVSIARKSGVEFVVLYSEGEKIKQLYQAISGIDEKQYEIMLKDGRVLSHQYEHFVFGSKVSLMFLTYEPVPEAHDIFKRLGKVFEQTYTRFLDLQKAEAQAREAQIQLALERVRARTMAMQSSDELAEVSYLLNKQVVELGIPTRGCAFNIYNERDSTEWFSSLEDTIPAYKTPRENIFLKYYEAGQRGETLLIEEFGGERIKEHYRYLATLSVSGKKDETIHEDVSVVPEYQIDHVAYFKYGYLLFITLGSALQAHEVFKRFAKEFEQTYTRFLDLKKAEAQAREAQIEAALERVRSRTMAMHRSDELKEAAVLMFQQVVALGVPAFGTGFNIWDDDRKFVTAWMAGIDRMQPPFKTSSSEDIFLRIYEAAQKGDVLFVEEQGGEALKTHYEYMNSIPVFKEIADKMAEAGQSFPTFQIMHCAFFSHGYLMFISFEPVPDAYDIFKRFAKVFEQTYTRFLDLQKAEAQAREAQIEAALERVRSKAMAMHSSEGLNATIAAFYRELEQFSITPRRCGVGLLQKNRIAELSTMNTMEHGNSIEIIGVLKMEGHWVLDGVYDNWILQKEFHPVLRGNEIKEYNQLLRPQVAFPEYPNDSAQFGYFFFFPEGGVYAWTEKEMKEDELNIYRRFTRVLSLTYKRYKDLKDAEANALEAVRRASLDRVRAEIASMRTVDDLQRITPIIWHELTSLGVPFVRCGVFIIDEATEHIQVHLSSPDGSALGALDLPFNSSELTLNSVNHWRQGIIFKTHWNKQEFLNFMQSMIKLGQISNPETYQGATQPPESLHLHFVPFKQGMLYAGNTSPLGKEALELVKALAESFSIAFARYVDFKQLQTAKNQIEKTFTELKAAQAQLIQAEKMASLGELTAGIAHEIQNPLNFVNNFSELSNELIVEMKEELVEGSRQLAIGNRHSGEERLKVAEEIAADIKQNLEKINFHGKRAADIVKGMLQHSRTSSGQKEPTDVNALADEYLRLAYHGLRAKDKSFNAKMTTDFDATVGKINIIPQDIGRVILNLITNAFYAVNEKKKLLKDGFEPVVSVSTKKLENRITISVKDNGNGIPKHILDKIFQPFFTTKPTGQGTGLGLSLSYDVVKAHGGELKIETNEGEGTEFIVQLPIN
jgi:signal transduction histidine kinase